MKKADIKMKRGNLNLIYNSYEVAYAVDPTVQRRESTRGNAEKFTPAFPGFTENNLCNTI